MFATITPFIHRTIHQYKISNKMYTNTCIASTQWCRKLHQPHHIVTPRKCVKINSYTNNLCSFQRKRKKQRRKQKQKKKMLCSEILLVLLVLMLATSGKYYFVSLSSFSEKKQKIENRMVCHAVAMAFVILATTKSI